MAKQNVNVPTKINAPTGLLASRPDFMTGDEIVGQEELKQFVIVPRAKLVQPQASPALLERFKPGDLMLSPLGLPIKVDDPTSRAIPDTGAPVLFTPIMFFVDWATWNPLGVQPAIVHRTADPNDPIVAKSRDPKLRVEPVLGADGKTPQLDANGKPLVRRHVEALNFIVLLHDTDITDPIVLTFQRGDHFSGQKFSALIRSRKANMFGCNFVLRSQKRPPKNGGNFYGIDVLNPSDAGVEASPWITDKAAYETMRELNKEWTEIKKSQGVRADMSETDDIAATDDEGGVSTGGTREL